MNTFDCRQFASAATPSRSPRAHWPLIVGTLMALLSLAVWNTAMAQDAGEIISVSGNADVWRDAAWRKVSSGEAVAEGDRLRTGDRSRVAILLSNGMQIKVNANSTLDLRQVAKPQTRTSGRFFTNLLRVLRGDIWVRTDGGPLEVETQAATATIRGTEFRLSVPGPESARLAVLEGRVEFANPQGRVMVAANELAVARVGEAPRKTVLLDPVDAVQWSLYYPRTFSYRDVPLSAPSPQGRTSTSGRSDAGPLIAEGEAAFNAGQRAKARAAFEGAIRIAADEERAHTGLGWTLLDLNEPQAALAEFERARSNSLPSMTGKVEALYRLDRHDEAMWMNAAARARHPRSALPLVQKAQLDLISGRADQALFSLDQAIELDPSNALALSLRSTVLLVQNRRAQASDSAQRAVAADPDSPSAYLAVSLVRQAELDMEQALSAAQRATALDPDSPTALIQESRLLFGMGHTNEALALAERARQRAPDDAQVNSTWGLLQLALGHEAAAETAFKASAAQDTGRGEPHLGMGLMRFRQDRTDEALRELRIATLLEPRVALYQSYLGKALWELDEDKGAAKHLKSAKELDPRDPTPYFYDALRLNALNRPNEAAQDLHTAMEMNERRGVYRSRLLLDSDLAARGATVGRLYSQLGFEQLAEQAANAALASDTADWSAHRLLADTYARDTRRGLAGASELLQSQLLQPLTLAPTQPQVAETNLLIPEGAGPSLLSFNEFNPLLVRERTAVAISGVAGNGATFGDSVAVSGLSDSLALSIGQFHYETDGFRANNHLKNDIYDAIAQVQVTPALQLQAEFRRRATEHGDLRSHVGLPETSTDLRTRIDQDTFRLGSRLSLSPGSDWLLSYIDTERKALQQQELHDAFPFQGPFEALTQDRGYQVETAYLFRGDSLDLEAGLGHYDIDLEGETRFDLTQAFGFPFELISPFDYSQTRDNAYVYSHWHWPGNATWTLGVSHVDQGTGDVSRRDWNPKFGLQWKLNPTTQVRLAGFQVIKPALVVEQTLEPTQVAGFNQFFDDENGAKSKVYGAALDSALGSQLRLGASASYRDIEIPIIEADARNVTLVGSDKLGEESIKVYGYWMADHRWSVSVEPEFQRWSRETREMNRLDGLRTVVLPIAVHYAHPSGFFSTIKGSFVDQRIEPAHASGLEDVTDQFFVADLKLGYRLPRRLGTVSLEALNLFDQSFLFQNDDFQTAEVRSARFIPDRQLFLRFMVSL